VDGVVLEQVGQVRKLQEIVDRHDLDVVALEGRAEGNPADSPESIDADLDHASTLRLTCDGPKDKFIAFQTG